MSSKHGLSAERHSRQSVLFLLRSLKIDQELERAEIDVMDYNKKWGRYRLRLVKGEIKKHRDLLTKLLRQAYGTGEGGHTMTSAAGA